MLRVVVHEFTSRSTIRIGRARYGRLAHTTRPEDRQPRVGHASEGHFAASQISIRRPPAGRYTRPANEHSDEPRPSRLGRADWDVEAAEWYYPEDDL